MKKFVSVVLSFVMVVSVLSAIPVTAFALDDIGKCGNDVEWSFDSGTGTLTLSGTGATRDYCYDESPFSGNSDITTVHIGAGITHIGECLFFKCPNLESVTISDTVETISTDAFCACEKLSALSFGNGVKTLEFAAFAGCTSLVNLNLPNSLETIGDSAFDGCAGLVNVVVPDSVKSLGGQAFYECTSLKTVSLGKVEIIGNAAFAGCSALTEFVLPKSVTWVGTTMLSRCAALTSLSVNSENPVYDSRDNCNAIIETATNKLVAGCNNTVIPASVTVIGYAAFNARPFENFTVPEGVTTIETNAFTKCASLKSICLPQSLKTVQSSAFFGCPNLANVYYAGSESDKADITIGNENGYNNSFINAKWYYNCAPEQQIGDSVFYRLDGDTLEIFGSGDTWDYASGASPFYYNKSIKTVHVGDGITGLGDLLFYDCTNLKTVSLPTGLKTIGRNAFALCSSLTAVNLPEGLTQLDNFAFENCKMSEIYIPSTLNKISGSAFSGCRVLRTVYLHKSIKSVDPLAFKNCPISHVYYTGTQTNKETIVFSDNDNFKNATWLYNYQLGQIGNAVYYFLDTVSLVVFGTGDMWDFNASNPSPFESSADIYYVRIRDGVTNVGDRLLFDCENLDTVDLPNSIQTIGALAFANCFSLTTINPPEGLTAIGDSAFCSCSGLTEISLPSTVTTIGDGAIMGCGRLISVSIPAGVTTIAEATFASCVALQTVYLNKNTTTVKDLAFQSCFDLKNVYYSGSAADKDNMSISTLSNEKFVNADWHLNYVPLNGTGTASDPYQIIDYSTLKAFAAKVNGSQKDACGKLMNDITCKNDENDTDYAADWTPIGTEADYYDGTFDGQGYVIRGLTNSNSSDGYIGLFGCVNGGATVQNVGLEDGTLSGTAYVGGIAGLNYGTIRNCYHTGNITGGSYLGGIAGLSAGTIRDCYNTGDVTGINSLGGIAGVGGTVINCYNTGNVTGSDDYIGGIVGYGAGETVSLCYNTGAVTGFRYVGGIVGNSYISSGDTFAVQRCYNTGSVQGKESVGGVAGYAHADGSGVSTIQNCYNTGALTATRSGCELGGIVGINDVYNSGTVTVENCYNTGLLTGDDAVIGAIVSTNNGYKGTATIQNCYYDSTLCGCDKAVFSNSETLDDTVKDLTAAQMTGEAANDAATMKTLFEAKDENGEKIWLDPKADGKDNGTYYWYYPHLRGFNRKADGTVETNPANIPAANWPQKVAVSVTWEIGDDCLPHNGVDYYTYNSDVQAPTVTSVTAGAKTLTAGTDYTLTYTDHYGGTVAAPKNADAYTATVSFGKGHAAVTKAFTIGRANLIITAKTQTYTYNGSAQGEFGATYTSDLDSKVTLLGIRGSDKLLSITLNGSATDVGEYSGRIVPSNPDLGDVWSNYFVACGAGTLKIDPIDITITAASQEWTYDGNSHENTAVAVTSGTLAAGDVLVASATGSVKNVADTADGNNPVAAGYKIMHGDTDVTANYAITAVAGTLTVNPRAITITAASDTWTYDGRPHENEAVTVTSGSLCTGDELEATATRSVRIVTDTVPGNNPVAAGYKIMHGNTDVTANYDITAVAGTLTIDPKTVVVKANDINIKYGDTEPELTAQITGVIGSDSVTFDLTRAAGDDVGEYTITASGAKYQGNYTVAYQNGLFTITNADAPTLTADEKPTANTLVEDGTAQELIAAPASLPNGYTGVEYKLDNGDWSEDIPTASEPGDYNVHVRYIGDKNHTTFGGDSIAVHIKALYTVTWLNDGSVFAQKTFAEDEEEPTVTDEPTKDADKQYTYTFKEWFKDDSSTVSNIIYNAIYTNTLNKYTVEFVDEDGAVLQSEEIEYGETPVFRGEEPTKAATAEFTYTFGGWDADIEAVTGDATYTATYTETKNKYTVTFADEDGTVLQSEEIEYGETPEFKGKEPTKAATPDFTFTFAGWDPEIEAVTGEATYTATYTKTKIEKKPGDDVPPTDGENTPPNDKKGNRETVDEDVPGAPTRNSGTADEPIAPVPAPTPDYICPQGRQLTWERGKDLVFDITRNANDGSSGRSHFVKVLLDNDDVAFTVVDNTMAITIANELLETLHPGLHTVTVVFDDGKVELFLEIPDETAPDTAPAVGTAPTAPVPAESKGFDKKHLLWIVPVSVAGVLAGAVVGTKKRRRKKK